MDLFTPVVGEEAQHPYFRSLRKQANGFNCDVLNALRFASDQRSRTLGINCYDRAIKDRSIRVIDTDPVMVGNLLRQDEPIGSGW